MKSWKVFEDMLMLSTASLHLVTVSTVFLPVTFDSSEDVHSQALLGFHMFLCCKKRIYLEVAYFVSGRKCLLSI